MSETSLSNIWQKPPFDENRRFAQFRGLLEAVSPAEEVAVAPGAGADLQAEGQAGVVEAARDHNGGHADAVDPSGVRVYSASAARCGAK